jgi:hypothetical protein
VLIIIFLQVHSQTQIVSVTVQRAAERFEETLVRYPRARVMQLEMFLEQEKRKTAVEAARANKAQEENSRLRKINHEIHDLYGKIGSMAGVIGEELLPATQKIVDLKAKLHQLYIKLGKDNDQATFETLCVAKEWDRLEPCVTNIVRAGAAKRELREREEAALSQQAVPASSPTQEGPSSKKKPAATKRGKKQAK